MKVGDIVQLDWVQLDYNHRSDNGDGEMVVDAETIQKEMLMNFFLGAGYMRKKGNTHTHIKLIKSG